MTAQYTQTLQIPKSKFSILHFGAFKGPPRNFSSHFLYYYPMRWNLAYLREMLFRETTQTPLTSTRFSFSELSHFQYPQGCQVAFLHENKLFRDAILYGLPAFESRMSSGDKEWVGYFPGDHKRSSATISSLVDFFFSRNNPDIIRPLCHRTSGVHIFPFLPYSSARQIFPLCCLPPEIFSGWRNRHLSIGASQKIYR